MKENLYTPGLNAAQIWAKLNLQYQLQTEEQLHLLWQQYYDFKHTAGTFPCLFFLFSLTNQNHDSKLSNIADQLREREQILPEVQLVSKALATLPENFRIVRTVWTSLPANDRTLDHLLQRLITEESVLKSYQKIEHNNDAAFTANNSRQRFNSGRGGSGREQRHGVQGGFVDKRPRCGHCNSPTHEEKVSGTWSVKGIGDCELDALGVGNIDVIVEVGQITTSRTLTEVLYVPGLGSNLFSVSAATANGLIVTFDDNKVSYYPQNQLYNKPFTFFLWALFPRFSLRETAKQSSPGRNKTRLYSNST
ncbi:hypothetical protein GHT06_006725 [Daphnia sinensis]|uniref:Retrovirus-related Pol polyprotein from transposon TNT 1-94-like beta-barrel domain-containing protein n=1 Tax=Daphnia sinensis TaxID=1820382 RepID=A0AAD5KG58_9CRUS|nr:hypothetical protein GHT06_006725 [Daphnia sinensis]